MPAQTLGTALQAGTDDGVMFLAGGTTVVDLLREGVFTPKALVGIESLPLRDIRVDGEWTTIGAMVSNSDVAWNPAIKAMFPVVSQAILAGASGQIRNMASTGGNLLQRTRCPYYRDLTSSCNKRSPGTGCAAIEGFNRGNAILGTSEKCIATHASDFAVSLVALDARVAVSGPGGDRDLAITDLHRMPGDTPERESNLKPGELIVAVKLPHAALTRRSLYLKVRDRHSYEFALASAAVAAEMRDGVYGEVRIALGGVGTVPWRARSAEGLLKGKAPGELVHQAAADEALRDAKPRRHNAFKVPLAKSTIVAALNQLAGVT
ncbi:MAG TPA: xanthine dehydrogenase family protein subunit M [Opitutaceae bacterium]|nr:xanthine dehydrogenase family protein subunit M [Opitutaceae bacterium]